MLGYDEEKGLVEVDAKNKFSVGDSVEVLSPNGNRLITVPPMVDKWGKDIESALGSSYQVRFPLNFNPGKYALLARNLTSNNSTDTTAKENIV